MNAVMQTINSAGREFIDFALPMLIQSSMLILILLLVDIALRRKVRAVFRYWIWMLVLVKLVLPPSLWSPVSFGTWFGDRLEAPAVTLLESPDPYQPQTPPARQLHTQRGYGAPDNTIDEGIVYHAPVRPSEVPSPPPPAPPSETAGAPPVRATTGPAHTLEWPGLVLLGWLAVVTALLLLLLQRALFVKGLVAQTEAAPARLLTALDECRTCMHLPNAVALRISPNATSPAVCGLLRPLILIPNSLAPKLQPRDLQAVLLHELAHIKRGDLWINLIQTLLQIVYFYNPLLWLANLAVRRVREQAVDEAVLVAMGEGARDYPQTLVNVAKLAFKRRPALSLRLIGVVESKSALSARIKHILGRPIPKSARLGLWGLLTIIIVAVVFLPMAKARPMTDRARQVMELAETEARSLNHSYVGTEHILLALMRQENAVSARVLANRGITIDALRAEVNKLLKPGPEPVAKRRLPRTPRAQRVMEYAKEEAKTLNHDYLGTEHILLALMREKEGIAAQVLSNLGLTWQQVRAETLKFVRVGGAQPPDPETAPETAARVTLPSGVDVELLGACEYPSKDKQWWRPDGSPLADAPYDKRGAWVIPNDRSKTPFEIALRVRHLPEHWEATVQSPDNSWSGASDPPYKAGKRLHELRWLVMQADPDQTTCKIRCDVVEPWQTIARTGPQIDISQQTTESGVAFTMIEKAFGSGVSVTITGPLGDPNDARLYSGKDLKRVIAVTKDGRIEESPFGGLLLPGEKSRRKVVKMKGERMEETIPAGPPSDTGIGSATVYFPRLPLADIEQFQYQTRALTSVEFRNVPLRPGKPAAVEVHIESTDRHQDPRRITLPDVDHEPFMLDLATAKLLTITKAESPAEMWQAIKTIGQGDLVYDSRALILVRDATTDADVTTVAESFKTYSIGQHLPGVLRVTTAEGRRYEIKILTADDKACTLTCSQMPADKGAGGGALVERAFDPAPEAIDDAPNAIVAKLPNGVTIQFLAYSWLSPQHGLIWYDPHGRETTLPGVYEADVESLGTVLAFRVEPPQANVYAWLYRGPDSEQIRKIWQLADRSVRLFALGQQPAFVNLRFPTIIKKSATVGVIPLAEKDLNQLIDVNMFGVGKIVDLQIVDSTGLEMAKEMMTEMGLPRELGMDTEIPKSMGIQDMVEPPTLQFTCINARSSAPYLVALLDAEGKTHPLERVASRRGDGTYQTRIWPHQLAGLVIEAAPSHRADARLRNISLTPSHVTEIQIEMDPDQQIEWVGSDAREALESLIDNLKRYQRHFGNRVPNSLWGLRSYYHDEEPFNWLTTNVAYIADRQDLADDVRILIAYDKTLLAQGKGTYVVYSDAQLEFTSEPQLKELGILEADKNDATPGSGSAEDN